MKHIVSLGVVLFILWMGLSGHTEPLMLFLGAGSTLLILYFAHRMDLVDRDSHPIHLTPRLLRFGVYLMGEIILANWDVVRRILTPGKTISPRMIQLPMPQRSDIGRVIYANSITLTPGTVSVHLGAETVTVHALSKATAEALEDGKMAGEVPDEVGEPTRKERS